jgi:hypothetical protein
MLKFKRTRPKKQGSNSALVMEQAEAKKTREIVVLDF